MVLCHVVANKDRVLLLVNNYALNIKGLAQFNDVSTPVILDETIQLLILLENHILPGYR